MRASTILLVLLGATAVWCPGRAVAEPPSFAEHVAQVEEAIRRGDDLTAMDLMCRDVEPGRDGGVADLGEARVLGFLGTCAALQHKRYDEVFAPPTNVDEIFGKDNAMPWNGFIFTASAFGAMWSDEEQEVYGVSERGAHGQLTVRRSGLPRVSIDLDRDQHPEVTYSGGEPAVAGEFAVVADRAPDGRRAQWLIAPLGKDPRIAPQIWLYRDGPAFFAIVDTGGDGKKASGRGTIIREF